MWLRELRTVVHGHPIEKEDVAVNVTLINGFDQLRHPQYNYSVEVGGFTAWKMVDCRSLSLGSVCISTVFIFAFVYTCSIPITKVYSL